MEKYGFVYIWYDRKHKRYYIGSHWGTEDDDYICSSRWMRKSYRRRPEDFKRRIITRVIDRKELLKEEHKWLSMICDDELGTRYYNLRKHLWGHWTTDEESRKTISEKIRSAWDDEKREKARQQKIGDLNPMKRPEVAKKAGESKKGRMPTPWNKGLDKSHPLIRELGMKHSEKMKGRAALNKGKPMTEEQRNNLSKCWEVTMPNGCVTVIRNLSNFCRIMGLSQANLQATSTGKRKTHKGYSCKPFGVS